MKRNGLLNAPLNSAIAHLGHTDTLVIGDAGLPVPDGPQRIDLALRPGLPGFFDVLESVAGEMVIERATIAGELADAAFLTRLRQALDRFAAAQGRPIALERVPHDALKQASARARAIVRTGEFTPYANIILHAGVCF